MYMILYTETALSLVPSMKALEEYLLFKLAIDLTGMFI